MAMLVGFLLFFFFLIGIARDVELKVKMEGIEYCVKPMQMENNFFRMRHTIFLKTY